MAPVCPLVCCNPDCSSSEAGDHTLAERASVSHTHTGRRERFYHLIKSPVNAALNEAVRDEICYSLDGLKSQIKTSVVFKDVNIIITFYKYVQQENCFVNNIYPGASQGTVTVVIPHNVITVVLILLVSG